MRENQILVIIKEPGKEAVIEPLFNNTLEAFQQAVGGKIETVRIASDLVIVCNEEGRIIGLPYNTTICGCDFFGTIIAVGVKRDKFASVKGTAVSFVLHLLNNIKRDDI